MKKPQVIFSIIALVALISGYFIFKPFSKNGSLSLNDQKPQAVQKLNISPNQGVIVENFKLRNWIQIEKLFFDSNLKAEQLDGYLGQLIYSLDTRENQKLSADSSQISMQPLLDILLKFVKEKELSPKGRILLSKILSKMTVSGEDKKKIKSVYKSKKWIEQSYWIDVSAAWIPLEGESKTALKKLVVKDRTDLLSDYLYYLNQIEDRKALKELVLFIKSKRSIYSEQHQRMIDQQLPHIEKKLVL